MKLHWSPRSPFVRKVMIVALELGLDDRIEKVRSVAAMSAPNADIMRDNPLSKIPTLVLADGTAIFDSLVICDYLNALVGGSFFPKVGMDRWDCLTRHALASGFLDFLLLWRNEREKPEDRQTPAWLGAFATKYDAAMEHLTLRLPGRKGAVFDIGDVAFGCTLSYLDFRFRDLEWRKGRSGLAAWHEEFSRRPAAIATEVPADV